MIDSNTGGNSLFHYTNGLYELDSKLKVMVENQSRIAVVISFPNMLDLYFKGAG